VLTPPAALKGDSPFEPSLRLETCDGCWTALNRTITRLMDALP